MEQLYNVCFNPHGFKEEDLSEQEWSEIKDEFLRLRSVYCKIVNGIMGYESINEDFDVRYPDIEYVGGNDINAYVYGYYVASRTMDLIWRCSKMSDEFDSDILQPIVIMDGPFPDFGARLKKHDNWYVEITLAPVKGAGS